MSDRPVYFDRIRMRAIEDWDVLTARPNLAGAWHQLFRQVQSPRHVLSELLQNADDAGATNTSVEICDDVFIFSHDGADFDEKSFSSLCNFGYSNKTTLHTIGFRGVGFKSTFSLGDRVEVLSPTLSICFERDRFTEPKWIDLADRHSNLTQIKVRVRDHRLKGEIDKNISEWTSSPASLLFFRNIRRLRLQDNTVEWRQFDAGPLPNSSWLTFGPNDTSPVLVIKSELEAFPDIAIEEIKNERGDQFEQDLDIPKCSVEIVLGIQGQLYVVLPTGVRTNLPFACNAPFIQDPARLQIKDPASSPTNYWLLERLGRLAASAMHAWVNNQQLLIERRSEAYRLMPPSSEKAYGLENSVCEIITQSFRCALDEEHLLLTDDGTVVGRNRAVSLPRSLCDVWTPKLVSEMFDTESREALSQSISQKSVNRLCEWQLVDRISSDRVLEVLRLNNLPRPTSWHRLRDLWEYLALNTPRYAFEPTFDLNIVPVQGRNELYAVNNVVRLGEKRLLNSEDDWDFLARYLLVVDANWSRYLTKTQREADEHGQTKLLESVQSCNEMMRRLGLEKSSDASKVISIAAAKYFSAEDADASGYIRFAHIAAKLGIGVSPSFQFLTKADDTCTTEDAILIDEDGNLAELLGQLSDSLHFLNSRYFDHFSSCTREEWTEWVESGKSRLQILPHLEQRSSKFASNYQLEEFIQRTYGPAVVASFQYPYATRNGTHQWYLLEDFDWPSAFVNSINAIPENQNAWDMVVSKLLRIGSRFWAGKDVVQVNQTSTSGTGCRRVFSTTMRAAWVRRLQKTKCLPDTHGIFRKPMELLLRTKETESLLDLELFVDRDIDTEANRSTLSLLGVRDAPPGPNRILDCLRALSGVSNAPPHEIHGLYRKLDQYCATGPTEDVRRIQSAFGSERLILTEDHEWVTTQGVFVSSGNDPIGLPVIHQSVSDLTLWRRIGVLESPDTADILNWIKSLPTGKRLSQTEQLCLSKQLGKYPAAIWEECGRWLNLSGELTNTSSLCYSVSMRSLVTWSHLFDTILKSTADFRMLSQSCVELPPFNALPSLASLLEERLDDSSRQSSHGEQLPWLAEFGRCLELFVDEDDAIQAKVRSFATRLTETVLVRVATLQTVPYIDGTPAGTSRTASVLWTGKTLYVLDSLSVGKLAKLIPETLGKPFGLPAIETALSYCFARSSDDISAYLAENFELEPSTQLGNIDASGQMSTVSLTFDTPETVSTNDESEQASQTENRDLSIDSTSVPSNALPYVVEVVANEIDAIESEDANAPITSTYVRQVAHNGPSPIERFATDQGFQKDGNGRFVKPGGHWIGRSTGDVFPWELWDSSGKLVRCYRPISHCLEVQPMQIGTEVWGLLESRPELYALILLDVDGNPIEITGSRLCKMRDNHEVSVHPATYRLVFERSQS